MSDAEKPTTVEDLRRDGVFICIRGGRADSLPAGTVACPLRCSWTGKAVDVVDHLGDKHGRRYEKG